MADNKDDISCPGCGSSMEKVYINSMGKNIDICLKYCGGIFFDNREFEKVDEAHECIEEITKLYESLDIKNINTNEDTRICPYCHAQMVKQNANGVIIDVCYTCGGKFLDYGELEQYRSQYANEEERSKAFATVLNNALASQTAINSFSKPEEEPVEQEEIYQVEAPTYTNGQMDEIVYSEPPKGLLTKLAMFLRGNKY